MGENVGFFPAQQIKPGPGRQKFEAGLRVGLTVITPEPLCQFTGQRMQVQNIGGGIFELRL